MEDGGARCPAPRLAREEAMKLEMEVSVSRRTGSRSEHHVEIEFPTLREGGPSVAFSIDGRRLEIELAEIGRAKFSILIGGRSYTVEVHPARHLPAESGPTDGPGGGLGGSSTFTVEVEGKAFEIEVRDPRSVSRRTRQPAGREHEGPEDITAPMPGRIVKLLVAENQDVRADEGLLIIEAMKMQNELRAPRAGRVEKIYVAEGAGVETGLKLLRLS
jgi:biotin carboxyl carrier protein